MIWRKLCDYEQIFNCKWRYIISVKSILSCLRIILFFGIKMKREVFLYYCNDCIIPFLCLVDHEKKKEKQKLEKNKKIWEKKSYFTCNWIISWRFWVLRFQICFKSISKPKHALPFRQTEWFVSQKIKNLDFFHLCWTYDDKYLFHSYNVSLSIMYFHGYKI